MKQLNYKAINFIILISIFFIGIGKMHCQNFGQLQDIDNKAKVMQRLNEIKESDSKEKTDFAKWWENITNVETNSVFIGWGRLDDFKGCSFNGALFGASYQNLMFDISLAWGSQFEDDIADLEWAIKELPQSSVLMTPQLYLKYFSIGCGLGIMNELAKTTTTISTNYQYSISETNQIIIMNNTFFALRPVVHGFIPIVRRAPSDFKADPITGYLFAKKEPLVSLLLSMGYDIVPNNSKLNKWCFAMGVSYRVNP